MIYQGSKRLLAKHLLPIMVSQAKEVGRLTWVEPFVGGGNMIDKVPKSFRRIGYDMNPHTIEALIGVRDYLENIPKKITEEYFNSLKGMPPNPITSLIRFSCSYGGRFEDTYARCGVTDKRVRNRWAEQQKNLREQSKNIWNVELICSDYKNLNFENCLIYCDPPYKGTREYKGISFNHDEFWKWCSKQVKNNNTVFVSEYSIPKEVKAVMVFEKRFITNISRQNGIETYERLYKCL